MTDTVYLDSRIDTYHMTYKDKQYVVEITDSENVKISYKDHYPLEIAEVHTLIELWNAFLTLRAEKLGGE